MTVAHGVCSSIESGAGPTASGRVSNPRIDPGYRQHAFPVSDDAKYLGSPQGCCRDSGYRFLRQRHQHNNPSIGHGITVVGRAPSVVCVAVAEILRRETRSVATGRSENHPPRRVVRTGLDATVPTMPRINLRQDHRTASEAVAASRLLTVFLGPDQGKKTFA